MATNVWVAGRITQAESGAGIHGLLVELSGTPTGQVLDAGRTRRDGQFVLRCTGDDAGRQAGQMDLHLRVKDRDGVLIHSEMTQASAKGEQPTKVEIRLDAPSLAGHLAGPLSWEICGGRLLSREALAVIGHALTLLGLSDDSQSAWLQRLLPPIDAFDRILDDAWGVLAGTPLETRRFRDMMDVLGARTADMAAWLSTEHPTAPTSQEAEERSQPSDSSPQSSGSTGAEDLIAMEAVVPVVLAAMHAAAGNAETERRNLAIAVAQLNAYGPVVALHRAAVDMLAGRPGGPEQLRGLFLSLGGGFPALPLGGPVPPLGGFGPDDSPRPRLPGFLGGGVRLDPCILQDLQSWAPPPPSYTITGFTPAQGCAGTVITITGTGFTNVPDQVVRFVRRGGFTYVTAPAQSWTDTKITVAVPVDAGCGPLSLGLDGTARKICGKFIDIAPTSNTATDFHGTAPQVLSFWASDSVGNTLWKSSTVIPGETVTLHWEVCPESSPVRLDIALAGAVIQTFAGLPGTGTQSFAVSGSYAKTTILNCRLSSANACGPGESREIKITVHRRASVFLTGIEVTQATQFFRSSFIPNPAARKPDQSVPLVAGKPTLVRVYAGTDQVPEFNSASASGLVVALRGFRDGTELPGSPLAPIAPTLVATNSPLDVAPPAVPSHRAAIGRTANFALPDDWITAGGTLSFKAYLSLAAGSLDTVDGTRSTVEVDNLAFEPVLPLECTVVRIKYTAKEGPFGPPSLADAIATFGYVRQVYPTHEVKFFLPEADDQVREFGNLPLESLSDPGGPGCSHGWNLLISNIEQLAKAYTQDSGRVWCGVLDSAAPTNVAGGCGRPGSWARGYAAFRAGDGETASQEIGHAFGMQHTFEDSNWPNYWKASGPEMDPPYSSIGEFGTNVERVLAGSGPGSDVYSPQMNYDFMSYQHNTIWTSPYTYMSLFDRLVIPHFIVTGGGGFGRPGLGPIEQLVVCGTLDERTSRVKLHRLYHLPLLRWPTQGQATPYELALVDKDGRTLVSEPVRTWPSVYGRIQISQLLPLAEQAVALEIRSRSKVLASIRRPPARPAGRRGCAAGNRRPDVDGELASAAPGRKPAALRRGNQLRRRQ
jgi:hypothetical protein